MARPPTIPADKKSRIVLAVLAGEVPITEAARREQVSEQSISRWKADFLEAGRKMKQTTADDCGPGAIHWGSRGRRFESC